jgi:hypothetical protein
MCAASALLVAAAPAALATTQSAQSGNVTATFTFKGKFPNFTGMRLTIAQGGTVLYDQPVQCVHCAPGSMTDDQSSVQALDLEHDGQPDVVLDLFTEGAHCCFVRQIFSFDPGTMTYAVTQHDFGNAGALIVDIDHNGRFEFLSADNAFAYAFTDFAASALPIQILTFSGGQFTNVTRQYPKLIAKDAARWMKAFKSTARQHYSDSVGVAAAWAADEELLGHAKLVNRFLSRQAKAGHLNSALSPTEPGGARFVVKLRKFLRAHGYVG